MRQCSNYALVLLFLVAVFMPAHAQDSLSMTLAVGSSSGQIGLVMRPNEECRGPASVTPASAGRLAVLDKVNQKIVVIGGPSPEDVPLPGDLVEPADLIATTRGYLVVGALGDVVVIDGKGTPLAWTKVEHNPEAGAVRLVAFAAGGMALEDLRGKRTSIKLDASQMGELVVPGFATAGTYALTKTDPNQAIIKTNAIQGPLASITLTSHMRIVNARAVWVAEDVGAIVAVQETRLLPEEAAFVRLVAVDANGYPKSEVYLDPKTFDCGIRRPFTRLTDGRVVSLVFRGTNKLVLDVLSFEPVGTATPKVLEKPSDVTLISEEEDVLKALERLNGTPDAGLIALSPISPARILERARASLDIKWYLASTNFSHPDVPNHCDPPKNIWRRPPRLDTMVDHEVKGIPYRWGGYVATIETFKTHLVYGRLAGDVCTTCQPAIKCVHPKATGQDCSGFVSYAWQIGNYLTTLSLPRPHISAPVAWGDLAPGDILNKTGSHGHVRLIESISSGPNGRILTVIESSIKTSCGGVCRRAELESDVKQEGYKPYRRVALTK